MPVVAPAGATRRLQWGVESVYGTAVAATKIAAATGLVIKPVVNMASYRAPGFKHDAEGRTSYEWSEGALSGTASFTEMVYLLSCLIKGGVTPTTVGTTTKKWVFAGSPNDVDTPASLTAELGNSVRAQQAAGLVIPSLKLSVDPKSAKISGTTLSQKITDPFTITPALAPITPMQMVGQDFALYADTTAAGLGTTQQLSFISAELDISGRWAAFFTTNHANASYDSVVEDANKFSMKILTAANSEGMAHLTTLRSAANTNFLRLQATGPATEAGQTYLAQFDLCGFCATPSDIKVADKVVATEWTYECKYDPTWAKGYSFAIQNLLTAL